MPEDYAKHLPERRRVMIGYIDESEDEKGTGRYIEIRINQILEACERLIVLMTGMHAKVTVEYGPPLLNRESVTKSLNRFKAE